METILEAVAIALLLVAGTNVHAGEENFDIDNRFRAKIAKEKKYCSSRPSCSSRFKLHWKLGGREPSVFPAPA